MPAPTPFTIIAYAVIVVVPIALLAWYASMYSDLGKANMLGRTEGSGSEEATANTEEAAG